MRLFKISALAVFCCLGTSAAFAADFGNQLPAPTFTRAAPVYNWTGAYAGVLAGADMSRNNYAFNNPGSAPFAKGNFGGTSATFGLMGGYNWQISQDWVAGIEADIRHSGGSKFSNNTGSIMTASQGASSIEWQGSVRGRLGYLVTPDTMLYGTAGPAYGWGSTSAGPLGLAQVKKSWSGIGWTAGAGIEHAFTEHVSARVEYRYTDFGTQKFNLAPTYPVVAKFHNEEQAVLAGITYKF